MGYNDISEYGKQYAGTLGSAVDLGVAGVGLKINFIQISNVTASAVTVTFSGNGGTAFPNGNYILRVLGEETETIFSFYSTNGLRISAAGANISYFVVTNESGDERS